MVEEHVSLDEVLEAISQGNILEDYAQHRRKETIIMNCSIDGCPGKYEAGNTIHTVRHRGQVTVIDHVPADVCTIPYAETYC